MSEPIAGVRNCPNCKGTADHAQLFCRAYPNGLPMTSKQQGLHYLAALSRFQKADAQEQFLIDRDLAICGLPESDPEADAVLFANLFFPQGLDELARFEESRREVMATTTSLLEVLKDASNEDHLRQADEALKSLSSVEPAFVCFRSKKGGEHFGILRGGDGSEGMVYDQSSAVKRLKKMVIAEAIDPDKFGGLKRKIQHSDLPKEANGASKRPHFTVFVGDDESSVIRVSDGSGTTEFLVLSKTEATAVLKNGITRGVLPFESYADTKKMIDDSPLPEEVKAEPEVIELPHGFSGVVTRQAGRVIDRKLVKGIGLKVSGRSIRFRALPTDEVRRSVMVTPPPQP